MEAMRHNKMVDNCYNLVAWGNDETDESHADPLKSYWPDLRVTFSSSIQTKKASFIATLKNTVKHYLDPSQHLAKRGARIQSKKYHVEQLTTGQLKLAIS